MRWPYAFPPPPHPGIPHEQSIKAGPGENGGIMVLDGPTFMATEGWDWIPAIRDRNTGLWQDVVLSAAGEVKIGDPQVVTKLPLPEISRADVEIESSTGQSFASPAGCKENLTASFEQISVTKNVTLPPGESIASSRQRNSPSSQFSIPACGGRMATASPDLYTLKLAVPHRLGNEVSGIPKK